MWFVVVSLKWGFVVSADMMWRCFCGGIVVVFVVMMWRCFRDVVLVEVLNCLLL